MKTSLLSAFGYLLIFSVSNSTVVAQSAFHEVFASDGETDMTTSSAGAMQASATEGIHMASAVASADTIIGSGYFYLGRLDVFAGAGSSIGDFVLAQTDITSLSPTKSYFVSMPGVLAVDDSGGPFAEASSALRVQSDLDPIDSSTQSNYSEALASGSPPTVTIVGTSTFSVTNISDLRFRVTAASLDDGSGQGEAICLVLEIPNGAPILADCDINDDGIIDDLDIDLLTLALNNNLAPAGSNINLINVFDVNGDGSVAEPDGRNTLAALAADPTLIEGDLDELIHTCLGTEYGDANLDGLIGQADMNTVLLNWGDQDTGWLGGDMNGDGIVSGFDLDFVSLNWGFGY